MVVLHIKFKKPAVEETRSTGNNPTINLSSAILHADSSTQDPLYLLADPGVTMHFALVVLYLFWMVYSNRMNNDTVHQENYTKDALGWWICERGRPDFCHFTIEDFDAQSDWWKWRLNVSILLESSQKFVYAMLRSKRATCWECHMLHILYT